MGTSNVLEAARKLDIKRVIYTSTGSVYLANKIHPPDGTFIKETDPVVPFNSDDIYASGNASLLKSKKFTGLNHNDIICISHQYR